MATHSELHGKGLIVFHVPIDLKNALRFLTNLTDIRTVCSMHGKAAAAGYQTYDRIPRYGRAAFSERYHQVVHSLNAYASFVLFSRLALFGLFGK